MNRKKVVVVSASNDAYFPGLCVTVASAVHSTLHSANLSFHILDTGLSSRNHDLLRALVAPHGESVSVHFHQITAAPFEGLTTDYGGGYSTYARLLVGDLVAEPRAIYVDADFLILRDLTEIWSEPIAPAVMRATPEWDASNGRIHSLSIDCPFLPPHEAAPFHYFNCGFLVIDLDAWRSRDIGAKAIREASDHRGRLKAWDQTILNYILRGQIGGLPEEWCTACGIDGIPRDANIHYISKRKPWNHWSPMPMYRAWYVFHKCLVKPQVPLRLSAYAISFGASCALRDWICARLRFCGETYLKLLRRKSGAVYADCYARHLDRYRKALADPEWRSGSANRILKSRWESGRRVGRTRLDPPTSHSSAGG